MYPECMQTQLTELHLGSDIVDELTRRARSAGVSESVLADVALRYALSRLKDDGLKSWAARQPSQQTRRREWLAKKEKAVLDALQALTRDGAGTGQTRFELGKIADTAGLVRRDAYLAAKKLSHRGYMEAEESPHLDRWGRPKTSVWWLVS